MLAEPPLPYSKLAHNSEGPIPMREGDTFRDLVCINRRFDYCWGCGAEPARRYPAEPCVTPWTFIDNTTSRTSLFVLQGRMALLNDKASIQLRDQKVAPEVADRRSSPRTRPPNLWTHVEL
jgi:hypothetical protein